jgi:hypothetical protein
MKPDQRMRMAQKHIHPNVFRPNLTNDTHRCLGSPRLHFKTEQSESPRCQLAVEPYSSGLSREKSRRLIKRLTEVKRVITEM